MRYSVPARWKLLVVVLMLLVGFPQSIARGGPVSATAVNDPTATLTLAGSLGGRVTVLALSGTTAFVGEGASLLVVDVSQPVAPTLLSRLPVGHVVGIAVLDTRIVVLTSADVQLIDVSDPARPSLRGRYRLPANRSTVPYLPDKPTALQLHGTDALIGITGRLLVVDVSDPAAPRLRASLDLLGSINQIAVAGSRAYIAGGGGLYTVDLRDPNSPRLLSTYLPLNLYPRPQAFCVALHQQFAYVMFWGPDSRVPARTEILTISDPASPSKVGELPEAPCVRQVVGERAYTGWSPNLVDDLGTGLRVFDVSTPTAPIVLGTYQGVQMFDVLALNQRIYITTRRMVQVLDAANPTQLTLLGSYQTPTWSVVARFAKGHAFVADYTTLRVFDLRSPIDIREVAKVELEAPVGELRLDGDVLALTLDGRSLRLFDIRDPSQPTPLGSVALPGDQSILLGLGGGLAVISPDGYDGTRVLLVDVADPVKPVTRGFYQARANLNDARVAAGTLYLAEAMTGEEKPVEIVDVRNLDQPVSLGLLPASGHLLTLQGNTIYVFGRYLSVVDVHDPTNPQLRGQQLAGGASFGQIEVVDGLAYLASNYGELRIYDVNSPDRTLLRARAPLQPWAVHVEGERVYVVDESDGLLVLDLHTDRFSSPIYLPQVVR